jgi:hypothetical protein
MELQELQRLINLPESPVLEFKRDLHLIYDEDGKVKRKHKDELIRDILALVNGNTVYAGETAHLIFGVDAENGRKDSCGLIGRTPTSKELIDIVNAVSDPPLADLICRIFMLEGKKVLVVIVPPSIHLHETKRKLETPNKEYSEHVVFMRRGDGIGIASAKERVAIQDLKRYRHSETYKVEPVAFGAVSGAIVGRGVASGLADMFKQSGNTKITIALAGSVLSSLFGGIVGYSYRSIIDFRRQIISFPAEWRPVVTAISIAISGAGTLGIHQMFRWIASRLRSK